MKLHRYKSYESVLRFSDGVTVDTSGPYRKLEMADGWYVVGGGKLIPIKSESEAQNMISKMFRTLLDKIAHEIVFQTPDEEGKVANKLLSDSVKYVIKKYRNQLKEYDVELNPNKIDPVLVYNFISDLEHTDREGLNIDMFNKIMSEWIVQRVKESFVPKKLTNRRDDLIKRYTKENEMLKKYVLGKGSYVAPRNNFETSSSLRDRMESKDDYTHSVTGEVFYFISKEESVELPIKAVDWKVWVEKLSKIDVDENGHIEEDFESYYAGDDTLSACLWWIGWYFELADEEVRREFNKY